MLTAGDALVKTLAKTQKITFWNQKNGFGCFFFLLIVGDALTHPSSMGTWECVPSLIEQKFASL